MAQDDPRFIVSRLFIAAPELVGDIDYLHEIHKRGLINDRQFAELSAYRLQIRRAGRARQKMQGQGLLDRILIVAPEIMSVSTINFLRTLNLISANKAHEYRIVLTALGRLTHGGPPKNAYEVARRLFSAVGSTVSNDSIALLRFYQDEEILRIHRRQDAEVRRAFKAGHINEPERDELLLVNELTYQRARRKLIADADKIRAALIAGSVGKDVANAIKKRGPATIGQMLWMIGDELFSADVVKAMRLAGLIGRREEEIFLTMMEFGPTAWRVVTGIKAADGYAQRLLIGFNGLFSQEILDALVQYGFVSNKQLRLLRPVVAAAREVTRRLIDENNGNIRRYRVIPNEAPIRGFARASAKSNSELLRLLAKAADESKREAEKLLEKPGIGRSTRSAQYRVQAATLQQTMRDMWEGIGHLIILGEGETARQALASMDFLQRRVWRGKDKDLEDLRRLLLEQAEGGVDSYISRQENVKALSAAVYKNRDLMLNNVEKRISIGLLRGQSAEEIALDVKRFIRPDVPGGAAYSAKRLARTEINNAFHNTSIRYTREMPWVTGYDWHLSGTHSSKGPPDICDTYAAHATFSKKEVPQKPHPNCLCYITPATVEPDVFRANMARGRYERYIQTVIAAEKKPDPQFASRIDRALARSIGS